jgi:hypothetical protein
MIGVDESDRGLGLHAQQVRSAASYQILSGGIGEGLSLPVRSLTRLRTPVDIWASEKIITVAVVIHRRHPAPEQLPGF